jgi:hypothetical protein
MGMVALHVEGKGKQWNYSCDSFADELDFATMLS